MKYNKQNKPISCILTESRCYSKSYAMEIKGILWHSTGANNPALKRYVQPSKNDPNYNELMKLLGTNNNGNDWNDPTLSVGVNAFIGKLADGTITTVQTLPWDWRPWGCGSGKNGSCNTGWIQFEICEAALTDKAYFEKTYKEACELTAYLCEMFNIDPNGTVKYNGVTVPTILCHADSYDLGLGSNHADIEHWFGRYKKTMANVRQDVAKLLEGTKPAKPAMLYRVRKTWTDAASQKGAFSVYDNAVACADANPGYYIFDEQGKILYPDVKKPVIPVSQFSEGDKVTLTEDAKYVNGVDVPDFIIKQVLYVRDINSRGIIISTQKTGDITGVVEEKYLREYVEAKPTVMLQEGDIVTLHEDAKYTNGIEVPSWVRNSILYVRDINNNNITISIQRTGAITGVIEVKHIDSYRKPYKVRVTASALNVRKGPAITYRPVALIRQNTICIIADEKNGWGYLNGAGWISLAHTKRID